MKLVKDGEGVPYEAKGHFNCWNIRKFLGGTETVRMTCAMTHFLPNGGADMLASPTERVYVGISGAILCKSKGGEEFIVEPGDMLYIPPNEERSVEVIGTEPATIMVFMNKLD